MRNADLEEGTGNFESMYAGFEKQMARKDAKLEAEEKERADLEATLEKENADLEATLEKEKVDLEETLEKEKADLEAEVLELKLEHKQEIKEIYDLYNEELQENMGQYGQVLELEEENEELKDQMMAMEGPVAGFGGDLSAEEQAYQQAKQQRVGVVWGVFRR
jgi:chromosome segregation ATPase